MSNPPNPQIPKSQYAIIQVELRTGIILTLEGKRHQGHGECFLYFESLTAAKEKAHDIVQLNPEIECVIDDDQNLEVGRIRDENHVVAILEKARIAKEQKNKWWKFW